MSYERVDIELLKSSYKTLTAHVVSAENAADVIAALMEHEDLMRHSDTMMSLAYTRNTIDTTDEFYDAEREFYDEESPALQESMQEFMLALYESKFRPALEEEYGSLMFKNMELDLKSFSPEIIPDLQTENSLKNEYQKLMSSAQIEFDGKTLNISQLGPYKENPDREIRKSAYLADGAFYTANADELDRIYDELVKCRTNIAKKLGYDSFTEVAYLRQCRNCYDAEMVASFRKQIVDDIVPIVVKLKKEQAERIGLSPSEMKIYDDPFRYSEGNPKPMGTPADILSAGKKMYEEMSPETAEFINFMYDNELLDVETKPKKAPGGYCTSFADYKSPFIFSNFNGTTGDVDVLTHEAGHALAAYTSRNTALMENANPTMESCEVHSMSMEFFAWPWLNLFYGDDADRARKMHLESALIFLPYGTMVDHFQHIIYDNPDLTPAQRHEKWLELESIYRPYIDFDALPFYGEGRVWQRQLHIYQYPFYYIDYCLAQTVALDIWRLSQENYKDAWTKYKKFLSLAGTKTFTDLCTDSTLLTPFQPNALKSTAKRVNEWLGDR